MKQAIAVALVLARAVVALLALGGVAHAAETKMVGVVTQIDLAGKDAQTATVTLKHNDSGEELQITIEDGLTLDKLKDHRIVEGDEIRCKYEAKGGKNVSTYFRKTAGC